MAGYLHTAGRAGAAICFRGAGLGLVSLAAAASAVVSAAAADMAALPTRGIVRAINQAALSTDVPMRITVLPFREGEGFRAGDVLVEFDCRRQRAELQAMRGSVKEAQLNVASSVSLDKFKAIGRNDVEIAAARLEKAIGELRSLEARVEDCKVVAPFAGRIAESPYRVLEFTIPQRPYLSVVEVGRNEIEMIIPSSMLESVTVGQSLIFRVDELSGAAIRASISSIGAVVDPVSKTLKMLATVLTTHQGLTAGMSGTAELAAGKQ